MATARKWADVEEDDCGPPSPAGKSQKTRLETAPDADGVKTVIEYVERAGQSYKITKKVKATTVTHKVNLGVVGRRTLPRFLDVLGDEAKDMDGKMQTEQEEVLLEPRKKIKADEDIAVDDVFGSTKKSVWAKFRAPTKDPETGLEEKKEEPAPFEPGKYIPPSMRGVGGGSGPSLMDLRAQEQRDRDALTLRVTNLSEDVREGDLSDLFGQFGRIQRIFLAKNPETKASKGFAFITFSTKPDAERAIKRLNGHGYDNLVLRVEWAKPQTARENQPPPTASDFRAELSRKPF